MQSHRKEFEDLRDAIAKRKGKPYELIANNLDLLRESLGKVATLAENHPDLGLSLAEVGQRSRDVLQAVRQSDVRGIKIPQVLQTLKSPLHQASFVRQIAHQIVS